MTESAAVNNCLKNALAFSGYEDGRLMWTFSPAEHYRQEAERLRHVAERIAGTAMREAYLEIAERYEAMARQIQDMAAGAPQPPIPLEAR